MGRTITQIVKKHSARARKPLVLLVGKSGSGKSYLASVLNLSRVVSSTTRPLRTGEVPGVDHHFVREADYAATPSDRIVAYTNFNGFKYWATDQDLDGKQVYIMDPAGVLFFGMRVPRDEYRIVYVRTPWHRRLARMLTREGGWRSYECWKRACARIWHDRRAFASFEKNRRYDDVIDT